MNTKNKNEEGQKIDYANLNDIKQLLKSDITSYRIAKDTGVNETSVNNYRKKSASVENMTLGTAIKLQKFYDQSKKEGKLNEMTRDEAFGRALGVLSIMSERLFEHGKPSIENKYIGDLATKPMTTYARAHNEITQYTAKFDEIDIELFDRLNGYIAELDDSTFTDDPLNPVYIIYSSKEQVFLRKKN